MQSNCVKLFRMLVYLIKVYFVSGFFPVTIKSRLLMRPLQKLTSQRGTANSHLCQQCQINYPPFKRKLVLSLPATRTSIQVLTLTAVGRFQLLARWPGTHSRILSVIERAAQTVLGVYLKRTCSRDTSASSALGVLNDYTLYQYKSTHSLTPCQSINQSPKLIPGSEC